MAWLIITLDNFDDFENLLNVLSSNKPTPIFMIRGYGGVLYWVFFSGIRLKMVI